MSRTFADNTQIEAAVIHGSAKVRVLFIASIAVACHAPSAAIEAQTFKLNLEVSAGGGFVGMRDAEVQGRPVLQCTPAPPGPDTCSVDETRREYSGNHKFMWRPALSTGLIFRWTRGPDPDGERVGTGVGAHFVFTPVRDQTRPAPATTVHFGTRTMQLFMGAIYMPTDRVEFPDGRTSFVGPANVDVNSFVRRDKGKGPTFFAGVVIAGKAVTQTQPSGATDAGLQGQGRPD